MLWLLLLDGFFWTVALGVSISLARLVYRRRDLSARLFIGMVTVLIVSQLHHLLVVLAATLNWLVPGVVGERTSDLFWVFRYLDAAAVVLFGCLTFHLTLVFPTPSRVIQRWKWTPLLFYIPGLILAGMLLTSLVLGPEGYRFSWALGGLGLSDTALPLAFATLTLIMAMLRLLIVFFSASTRLIRQQAAWGLGGLVLGGGLLLVLDCLPTIFGTPSPIGFIPGLRPIPILIILGTFALAVNRFQFFDVQLVINRSVVYSMLIAAITIIYLLLGTVLVSLFQLWSPGLNPVLGALLATLIVVLVALPLRDAIQRLVDRFFLRSRVDYRRLLQDYSRTLTSLTSLHNLLVAATDQVEEVFHPTGLALVLADNGGGYRVMLCRGELVHRPLWREGAAFSLEDSIPAQLVGRDGPFYLPWHAYDLPEHRRREWEQIQESGAHLFMPMQMGGRLCGWFVLGPKLSELSYTRQDLGFLTALVDQSCVALENARLYNEMRQRGTELALVAMVSSAISSSLDLELVLETIVESVARVIGCDKSAIFEVDEEGGKLSLRMARGLSQAYAERSLDLPVAENNRALALATGEPLIVPDIRAEPRLTNVLEMAEMEGYRAVIDVPLVGHEGALGVLSVYFDEVHTPSIGELEVLTTFASQASIAIENARLYAAVTRERDRARQLYEQTDAALARRVEELTTIEEISRQLTSTLDLQQVMDLMLERAVQATQAERGFIALLKPEGDLLQLVAVKGYPAGVDEYQTAAWPLERGIVGRVARTRTPALVPDVARDPDYVVVGLPCQARLSVPIIHEDEVLGVMAVESDREAAFTREHVRFVELLAEHAVIGLNNAQLFQQVREARDHLHAVLNSTQDLVIVMDTEGQIILTNRRVRDLFGGEIEDWLRSVKLSDAIQLLDSQALPFLEVDVDDLVQVVRRIREYPHQEVEIAFSFQSNGRLRHMEGTVSPMLSTEREVVGWVAVVHEVTQRKELEKFREDLTSMVIHNLQGPLAALISSLETLRGNGEFGSDMAEELVNIALMSGQKLYSRIESLLWIRRLEERRMPLNLQPLPLWTVVQPIVDEYLPLAGTVGVSLETVFAPNLPSVLVDEEIIGRVFSNLLDNALKYVPEGGQVQVRASLELGPEGPYALCVVADNGPGISESLSVVLFEKFRRGEPSPRERRKGMGIGLHYCKVAVEAHGGRIWVESQKDQGSEFYFTLPVVTSQVSAGE